MKEFLIDWVSEWLIFWGTKFLSDWVSEKLSFGVTEFEVTDFLSEGVSEWLSRVRESDCRIVKWNPVFLSRKLTTATGSVDTSYYEYLSHFCPIEDIFWGKKLKRDNWWFSRKIQNVIFALCEACGHHLRLMAIQFWGSKLVGMSVLSDYTKCYTKPKRPLAPLSMQRLYLVLF